MVEQRNHELKASNERLRNQKQESIRTEWKLIWG
jgi:hypothetical protein